MSIDTSGQKIRATRISLKTVHILIQSMEYQLLSSIKITYQLLQIGDGVVHEKIQGGVQPWCIMDLQREARGLLVLLHKLLELILVHSI